MPRCANLQTGARIMFRKWFRISGPHDERMTPDLVTLEIHHGGYFETQPDGTKKYKIERTNLSGGICWVDWIDPGKFSWADMCNIAYELGYREKPIVFHFKLPKTTANEGWWHFKNDGDAQEMIKLTPKRTRTIPVYITGGGLRRVQEAMNDELNLNPPRATDWFNPLSIMTQEEVINAETAANLAAIQLHARRPLMNRSNMVTDNRVEHNVNAGRVAHGVEEGNNSNSTGGPEVVNLAESDDDIEPLGSLGPLLSLNKFIDDIGTQTDVNGDRVADNQGHGSNLKNDQGQTNREGDNVVGRVGVLFGKRIKQCANKVGGAFGRKGFKIAAKKVVQSSPVLPIEEESSEEEWLRAPAPTQVPIPCVDEQVDNQSSVFAKEQPATQASGITQEEREALEEAFAEEERAAEEAFTHEWFEHVNLEEVASEETTSRNDKGKSKVNEKRPSKLKKSSASWKGKEVLNAERSYNTRYKGQKKFQPNQEDARSDSSDESFFVDEDYDLRDGADDVEFTENVAHGDTVEEAVDMGYGGEISDDAWDSDALSSIDGSDHDFDEQGNRLSIQQRREKRVKAWNRQVDLVNPHFALGQLFPNHATFREAVREYSIRTRRGVWFQKNQRKKLEIKCQPGCPFYIGAKLVEENNPTVQVRTYRPEHDCDLQNRSVHFTYNRVAAEIREQLLADPGWSLQGIQETIQKKYNLDIPIHTITRGRSKARRMNEGHYLEQYNLLYSYRNELKRTNPGTTCEILCSHEDGVARFKRIYICFGALKEGWKRGCRRLIGLDGTHLKGPHTGQLLCAIGIDGNNGMYPIAYAVAEMENTETWTWFLEYLKDDLEIEDSYYYTFMSDKQKGLGAAIRRLFPESEHRHCVRHLYNNFKLAGHTGEGLKQTLWNAARCARPIWFEQSMLEMQRQSEDAFDWFNDPAHQDRSPNHWSRSHFRFEAGCDILINNICEIFNASIMRARTKPILTMLEMIRLDLMTRMANRRVAVTRWKHACGPRIVKQIERTAKWTKDWRSRMAGEYNYQVEGGLHGTMHCVDLRNHTCDCRKWELSGIPCVHVICALRSRGWEPTAFVNENLKNSAYLRAYTPIIMPISDKSAWKRVHAPVAPPQMKKQPGRPPMKRRPSAGENLAPPAPTDPSKLSRKGVKMTCQECKQQGHNKTGCPTRKRANGEGSLNGNVLGEGNSNGSGNKRKRPTQQSKTVADKAPQNGNNIVVVSRRTAKKAKFVPAEGGNGKGPSNGTNRARASTDGGGSQFASF